jgi:2-polyprenyl-3-methyl-5-hydroxy-6-metoxy-1,4-benzoquinol methylase
VEDIARKKHWENVYQTRSPHDVSWYQNCPEQSLKLIGNNLKDKTQSIIDVGGGASTLVDYLIDAQFSNLSVLDISEQALQHAKSRLREKAEQVKWYNADILTFQSPELFDLWHDRAVFHFLIEEHERTSYLLTLKKSLRKNAQVIIATFGINGPEKCSGLAIKQYDKTSMIKEMGNEFVLLSTFDEVHFTPNGSQQLFSYFHFEFRA